MTQVKEVRSLGFTEVGDNLICWEALCFGEVIVGELTCSKFWVLHGLKILVVPRDLLPQIQLLNMFPTKYPSLVYLHPVIAEIFVI